jgi:hypothetical protein
MPRSGFLVSLDFSFFFVGVAERERLLASDDLLRLDVDGSAGECFPDISLSSAKDSLN